jgi:phosphohistidine phosphatase
MKTLLLLRHAKSVSAEPGQSDFDRTLDARGVADAKLMGSYLQKQSIQPDLVITSPAERARQTTGLVLDAAKIMLAPRYDERIYEASSSRLLRVVSEIDGDAKQVLMVGHNPGFEELLFHLTGEVLPMPTAALAQLRLDVWKWDEARDRCGQVEWFVKPEGL